MGYAVICDDYDPCTDHGCNPQIGCEHTPRDTDDGDFCTIDDCNSDGIITHIPVNCDDYNACTDDSCCKETGTCKHELIVTIMMLVPLTVVM